jgi:hypothetical protein
MGKTYRKVKRTSNEHCHDSDNSKTNWRETDAMDKEYKDSKAKSKHSIRRGLDYEHYDPLGQLTTPL